MGVGIMSMTVGSSDSGILSGGMLLQPSKTEPSRNGGFPDTVPLSQIGTAAQVKQAGNSGMLPAIPSMGGMLGGKGSVDLYA